MTCQTAVVVETNASEHERDAVGERVRVHAEADPEVTHRSILTPSHAVLSTSGRCEADGISYVHAARRDNWALRAERQWLEPTLASIARQRPERVEVADPCVGIARRHDAPADVAFDEDLRRPDSDAGPDPVVLGMSCDSIDLEHHSEPATVDVFVDSGLLSKPLEGSTGHDRDVATPGTAVRSLVLGPEQRQRLPDVLADGCRPRADHSP